MVLHWKKDIKRDKMGVFTVQKHFDHTSCPPSQFSWHQLSSWLHKHCVSSLHRDTVINKEKAPVYISPIKHLWSRVDWGREKAGLMWIQRKRPKKKEREKWKKRNPLKLLQDDSLKAKREGMGVKKKKKTRREELGGSPVPRPQKDT